MSNKQFKKSSLWFRIQDRTRTGLFAESRFLSSFVVGNNIFDQNMLYIFSQGSMKDFQASGETSSYPETTFLSSKLDISPFSLLLGAIFAFPDLVPDPDSKSGEPHPDLLARLNPDPHHEKSASSWPGTLIKRKLNFSSYSDGIGCKVIYEEGLPNILYDEMNKYFHHIRMKRSLVI